MYINDRPIKTKKEDFLERTKFADNLAKSLYDWKEDESLVISLTGKWGSGKSSVLNLVKENINNDVSNDKPTIIDFNPWMFSNASNLNKIFFTELAKELKIKNESKKDNELAEKILLYSELINFFPPKKNILSLVSKITLGFGLFGITSSQLISTLNLSSDIIKKSLLIIGIILILIEILKYILLNTSKILKHKAKLSNASINKMKEEIQDRLIKRNKKLVIFIDDIDRLTPSEVKEIFKLVRVNADFPNSIYILAYDNEIIEKNIEYDNLTNGKSYVEKIVQVNFNIPKVNNGRVIKYLFNELDRIIDLLPTSYKENFDSEYWSQIFHSGYKSYFITIRDVKRYISSLEFNISLMHKEDSMEVNPIDFIAIEAIRVFNPSLFNKLKLEKDLFTMSKSIPSYDFRDESQKKEMAKRQFDNLIKDENYDNIESIKNLLFNLFPNLGDACSDNNISYSSGYYSIWRKHLRVCSPIHFETYFALIPGGDTEEISQYEIDTFINNINDTSYIEESLIKYQENNQLKNFIERFRDFVEDAQRVKDEKVVPLIQAIFNISDKLIYDKSQIFEISIMLSIEGIINSLLKRFEIDRRFNMLKDLILQSASITLPFALVSYETHLMKSEDSKSDYTSGQIIDLQKICISKIHKLDSYNNLLNLNELPSVLYNWSEWTDKIELNKFLETVRSDASYLLSFVDKFFTITTSNYDNRFSVKQYKLLSVKSLNEYIDPDVVVSTFKDEKERNSNLYSNNKDLIEKIIDNILNKGTHIT